MALSVRLQTRQTQSLAMTPQLVQSIKLLQMNSVELLEHIGQEIEKNPLLELVETGENYTIDRASSGEAASVSASNNDSETAPLELNADLDTSSAALEEKLGTSLENEFDSDRSGGEAGNGEAAGPLSGGALGSSSQSSSHSSQAGSSSGGMSSIDGDYNIENFLAGNRTLRDHLGEQLALMRLEQTTRLIAADIIDSLDSDGYFRKAPEKVALELGSGLDEVHEALKIVQSMEPTGVGACDISESIALQLIEKNRYDPAMERLVNNLEMLAKCDFNGLAKLCDLSLSDIMDMVEEIRALDPRPARQFDHSPTQEIITDVFINELPDGSFGIELNSDALPKVLINQTYQAIVQKGAKSSEDKAFVTDCIQNANWLTKSLEQRAQTILKVTTEIVKQQDAFFAFGIKHLRPMSLKRIADEIKMHESTVSRVTSNKYLMCNRGTFELKFFFTASIASVNGEEAHSAESVRHEIAQLIESEELKNIYSDDAIVRVLQTKGIEIARRTVAKYREALHIPSSVQRRREKKAANLIT
ncbi:MAG: RNA polymerase sigma-54 factor [Hyphomicrobiales bacterium]|nr:MAG: RNA polymerase sigma-54 factor [Hyphomicrobiales bacterium]